MKRQMKPGTICVQGGYRPKNGEPVEVPIIQSTTFKYDDSDEMAHLFDLKKKAISTAVCKTRPMMPWRAR